MDDVTRFGSSSSTLAELDRLFEPDRARQRSDFEKLGAIVARLGIGTPAEPDPFDSAPLPRAPGPVSISRPPAPEPESWIALPERTTHGGPYGRSIRDAVAESYRKRSDW